MIAVMGATGNVGGHITRKLLAAGEQVRALGRSPGKLSELERAGARTFAGDAADPDYLSGAFGGARAVFTMLASDPSVPDYRAHQARLGEAIVNAVAQSGVGHVVALSSLGAELASGTGVVASLHAQERRLREVAGTNVLALRPGWFFENFSAALGVIEEHGVNADTLAPDAPIPMIATRDIAAVAAAALQTRGWEGFVVRELLGERDLGPAEATRIIGAGIGKPDLPYVQLPYAAMTQTLIGIGFSEEAAGLYVELARALNEGAIRSREGRNLHNTTPTSFEEFAAQLTLLHQAA